MNTERDANQGDEGGMHVEPPRQRPLPGAPLRVPIANLAEGHALKLVYETPAGEPEEVVVCRLRGRLFALDSLCPHEGGRIADGPLMDERYLLCPLHLYRFRPDDGQVIEVDCPPARTFEVDEQGDEALVWVNGRPR